MAGRGRKVGRYAHVFFAAFLTTTLVVDGAIGQTSETGSDKVAPAITTEDDPDVRTARDLFRQGTELSHQGLWDDALSAFERSYELRPHPITSYNIGYCQRAIGRYVLARQTLLRALSEHERGEYGKLTIELLASIQYHQQDINRRMARLTLTVRRKNTQLLVDGRPLKNLEELDGETPLYAGGIGDPGPARPLTVVRLTLLLDPGPHVLAWLSGERELKVHHLRLDPGSRASLELMAPREPARQAPPPQKSRATDLKPWAYAALGVGAAGLAVGGLSGLYAIEKRNTLEESCGASGTECPAARQGDINSLHAYAQTSTIAFGVGAAFVAAGVTLLFALPDPARERPSIARLRVGPGELGLALRF